MGDSGDEPEEGEAGGEMKEFHNFVDDESKRRTKAFPCIQSKWAG